MSIDLSTQIQTEVHQLDAAKQLQVLVYVRTLQQTQRGMTGEQLKDFAGTFTSDDAKNMMDVIHAGCEQVDLDEW